MKIYSRLNLNEAKNIASNMINTINNDITLHKNKFKKYDNRNSVIIVFNVIMAVIFAGSGSTSITSFMEDFSTTSKIAASIIAGISLIATILMALLPRIWETLKFSEKAEKHKSAVKEYTGLKSEITGLNQLLNSSKDEEWESTKRMPNKKDYKDDDIYNKKLSVYNEILQDRKALAECDVKQLELNKEYWHEETSTPN